MALGDGADLGSPATPVQTLADALRAIAALPVEAGLEEVAALIAGLEPEDQRLATQVFLQSRSSSIAPRVRKGPKRTIVRPGSKTKEGLTLDQQRDLLKRAGVFWRAPATGHRRMDRPGCLSDDLHGPELKKLLYLMMWAGLHRDIVVDPVGRNLRCYQDGNEVVLAWDRIKKTGLEAMTKVPLPEDDSRVWGPAFVEWLRQRDNVEDGEARKGGLHYKLLDRILETLGREMGLRKRLSSYSLRHTTGLNLASRGFPSAQIAGILNCTVRVAEKYCRLAADRVADEMRARGGLVAPWAVKPPPR